MQQPLLMLTEIALRIHYSGTTQLLQSMRTQRIICTCLQFDIECVHPPDMCICSLAICGKNYLDTQFCMYWSEYLNTHCSHCTHQVGTQASMGLRQSHIFSMQPSASYLISGFYSAWLRTLRNTYFSLSNRCTANVFHWIHVEFCRAGQFSFAYDKLLEVKSPVKNDIINTVHGCVDWAITHQTCSYSMQRKSHFGSACVVWLLL